MKTSKKHLCASCGRRDWIKANYDLCSRCSVYHKDLKEKISYLTKRVAELKLKAYGIMDGSLKVVERDWKPRGKRRISK